jgi:hypothetical protein
MGYNETVSIENLVGKTLVSIANKGDEIVFIEDNGSRWLMNHEQDCCESVTVEDICGDLDDLINTPIIQAFEKTSTENPAGVVKRHQDSFTWTFYTLSTIKGTVTIRWYSASNGYYSETVDFYKEKT